MALTKRECLVCCIAMFWQVSGAQGAVVTNPSSIAGVAFIGPGDPSFDDAVTKVLGPSRTLTTNDWLPFSAVLTNNTSQPIVAVIVKWVKVLPDGRKGNLVVHRDFVGPHGRPVQSGQSAVALPGWVLEGPLPSGSRDATDRPDHITKLQTFQTATSVEVTLDGILLASGQFLGPNDAHGFEELLADQAARSVYSEALARDANGQSVADVVNWLTGIAGQGQDPDQAQRMEIDPQTGVQTNASRMATIARVLLQIYKHRGASAMYQFARAQSLASVPSNIFR